MWAAMMDCVVVAMSAADKQKLRDERTEELWPSIALGGRAAAMGRTCR